MNIQTVKAAAGRAARKTKKPRVAVDLLLVLSIVLTVLAALPYQLGELATIIPPSWKPAIALLGLVASMVLGAIRPYLPSPNVPTARVGEPVSDHEADRTKLSP